MAKRFLRNAEIWGRCESEGNRRNHAGTTVNGRNCKAEADKSTEEERERGDAGRHYERQRAREEE